MLGIPMFLVGCVAFIVGIVRFNIAVAFIGGMLLVISEQLIEASRERMNDE